jgi:hypothetical protein
MAYQPRIKDTLLIPSGPGNHLHIVMTPECAYGHHLLVSFSSVRGGRAPDTACIVQPGEHRFVKVESYVAYHLARTVDAPHLVKCVDAGLFKPDDPVDDLLFDRIFQGLRISKFVKRRILNYLDGDPP